MEAIVKKNRARFNGKKVYKKRASAKKKTKLNVLSILAFFGVFITTFLFYTWVHVQVVHLGYDIAQSKKL